MQTIKDIDIQNKRVLVRVGFNVPLGKDGEIDKKEAWRIKKGLPTIKYLLKRNCKIILATHLGRPNGKVVKSLRLGSVQNKLSEFLGIPVLKTQSAVGYKVEKVISKMRGSEILLLENIRFYSGEEKNDLKFAKKLAKLADIYINDAFSVCHRRHASVVEITKCLPSFAGLLLEKEIKALSEINKSAKKPTCLRRARRGRQGVMIIGGAKTKTKLPLIKLLTKKFDFVLVGGIVANKIKNQKSKIKNIELPVDYVFSENSACDIGPKTIKNFSKIISKAKIIVWNGPMGKFEDARFSKGTKEIGRAIAKSKAYKIIGGGETVFAASKFNLIGKMDFVSTGGGAMLEFLADRELPGLKALGFKN